MKLSDYFENVRGTGVLATADSEGKVDVAVYARPHVMDEETVAFIMADRLSHRNLQSNPYAAYLFMEAGEGYAGKRLHLIKVQEETDTERIEAVRRRKTPSACLDSSEENKYLVHFRVESVRPLIGDGPEPR
jgi:hypothetical protein